MEQNHKLEWADNLRVLGTVCVILLHVAAPVLYKFGSVSNLAWWTGNIYDSCVRFCVPVFVMLTGALLLRKEEKPIVFLKKRLFRVILPFLFWSLVYIGFNLSVNNFYFATDKTLAETINWVLNQLKNSSSYHLWYVYMIIGVYLTIPVIGKWARSSNEKEQRYFVIIWLISIALSLFLFLDFRIYLLNLSFFSGFIGYLVLGYYLSIQPADHSGLNKLALPLIILGAAGTAIGTYYLSVSKNEFNEILYDSLSPGVIALSSGVFLFVKRLSITSKRIVQIRDVINKYSFGIYLAHVLVLTLLETTGIYWNLINPVIGIPLTTLLCVFLTTLLVYLVNKLPFGKYISG
jgi:surface polysaccharide O-acyltransferase-like enzyme